MRKRLVIEIGSPSDCLTRLFVTEVDAEGRITGTLGQYASIDEAKLSVPIKWSDRVPEAWKPDVIRVGPWYDDNE